MNIIHVHLQPAPNTLTDFRGRCYPLTENNYKTIKECEDLNIDPVHYFEEQFNLTLTLGE